MVELDGFVESTYSVQHHNGNEILTLHDTHGNVETYTFDNFSGTLVVSASGGKTFIYDPPAGAVADTSAPTTADDTPYPLSPVTKEGAVGSDHAVVAVAIAGSADFFNEGGASPIQIDVPSWILAAVKDGQTIVPSLLDGAPVHVAQVSPAVLGGDQAVGPSARSSHDAFVTSATTDGSSPVSLPQNTATSIFTTEAHIAPSVVTASMLSAGSSPDAFVGSATTDGSSSNTTSASTSADYGLNSGNNQIALLLTNAASDHAIALPLQQSAEYQAALVSLGGTLDIKAPSNETVTFAGGIGTLVLDQPDGFSGQITGFTGTAPDAAHSDVVELLNFANSSWSAQTCGSGQILTLCEANGDVVKLTFAGFTGTFVVNSDGHGDTLIYDPPANGSSGASLNQAHIASSAIAANRCRVAFA